ncbi:MAG: CDP-glycerol glycerophosphotransferase family protein [Clostridiales bacterium]|nr:CDP-glycerol glycerophosphotransferase family protein [Clostridiales bacterium]
MKRILLAIAKAGLSLLYLLFRPLRVKNKVVMLSRESDTPPIDFALLREELARIAPETEVVMLCRKQTSRTNPVTYCLFLVRNLYHIATASVAVSDTYSIPLCVLHHKPELKIVQIWHAVGAVKRFSYQCLDKPDGHSSAMAEQMAMHRNYDYILCASEATRHIYAQAFDALEERILPLGMPRIDYIQRPDPDIRERYLAQRPQLRGKILALYLPTFRDGVDEGVQALVEAASGQPEVALLVKPHPLSRFELPEENRTARGWSTYDLMKVCDVIVTDYSAASLEASLLHKPVYFYLFDKEQYMETRGLNIDPEAELPLASFRRADQLLESVALGGYDLAALEAFRARYIETADRNNTADIAAFLCTLLPERSQPTSTRREQETSAV